MPQDLAETRLLTARSSRRRRRFAPRTASLLDWTGMQSILSSLQTETARLALRWPASHLAAQRCVGTALNAEELHAAAAFQRGVDARRSPIESALRVLVASAGERVPPNMSVPGCVVISSVDGASMPASLPVASRAVLCHACRRVCPLLPLEALRTCSCTACCFCRSCKVEPRDHECTTALRLAYAVVDKLERAPNWPFASVVSPSGVASLPITASSGFGWAHLVRTTIPCALTETERNFMVTNLALVTRLVGERIHEKERCLLCERCERTR
jgi:hypothetical protein|eukprot:7391979-Prymnesium_polylepis.2